MAYFETIALGVLSSLVASFVFWFLTFRFSGVKVKFSECIEKSHSIGGDSGKFRYMIRILNIGNRNLYEVSLYAKVTVKIRDVIYYTYVEVVEENQIPVLRGRKDQIANPKKRYGQKLTLRITETSREEFKKKVYPKKIQAKAFSGELSIDDIFECLPLANIQIFLFGNDAITGRRCGFFSPKYTKEKIAYGKFTKGKPFEGFRRYREYVNYMFAIEGMVEESIDNSAYLENEY